MITVTEKAAKKLQSFLERRKETNKLEKTVEPLGFRFGIKAGGCSSFEYVFHVLIAPEENDQIFESNGIKIYVSPKSLKYIDGTEIDHTGSVLQLLDGLFFINPNAKSSCGCNKSFELKK